MKTIRDVLMTYEPRPSAELNQALKEISELLLECKPKDLDALNTHYEGYNQALDDYEKNIKASLK